jgi:poly-beta-1,6-N-acetyl-D-glucosamine synthase
MTTIGFANIIFDFIIFYFFILNAIYILLLFKSIRIIVQKYQEQKLGRISEIMDNHIVPPTSIILPCYNEEEMVLQAVYSLLDVNYPSYEIIVINDGSTDDTLKKMIEEFQLVEVIHAVKESIPTADIKAYYQSQLHEKLIVIDKEHSSKADSLNVGINVSTAPIVLTVDADGILEDDALKILVFDMLTKPHTVAQGGSIYLQNGCKIENNRIVEHKLSYSPTELLQSADYLRTYVFGRPAWVNLGGPLILAGGMALFEKSILADMGGFKDGCVGEDVEIILHLHRHMTAKGYPYKVGFSPAARTWISVPKNMVTLWRQRNKWQRGTLDSVFAHITMLFNPRYKAAGLLNLPFLVFGELMGPVVELLGYIAVIISIYYAFIDWRYAILFFLLAWGVLAVITMASVLVNLISFNPYKRLRDILIILLPVVTVEQLGFRQILVLARVVAIPHYAIQKISGWIKGCFKKNKKKSKNQAT